MPRQKLVILPKLEDFNGDLSKKWSVTYSCRDHKTGKMERFRTRIGLSGPQTKAKRYEQANKLIEELTLKLKAGWTPFVDDVEVIYDDHLRYSSLAKEFGRLKKSNKTFNYYFSLYLTEIKPNVRPPTYTTYKSKLRLFEIWLTEKYMEDFDVSCFNEKMAKEFIENLVNERKITNNTLSYYLLLLKAVFNWLIDQKVIFVNPFIKIKIKKQAAVPAKFFNDGILQKMKEIITKDDPQLWLAALFQYYCFIRPKELRLLKVGDLDFDNCSIQIPGAISKNGKTQSVVMPEVFRQFLFSLQIHKANPGFYIITKDGIPAAEPVGRKYIYDHFVKIRIAMGLPKEYKLYSFKHTGAVKASKVIPMKDLQMQLRHHSLDMVDRYLRQMSALESPELRNLFPSI